MSELKNFPVEVNGEKLWISRSLACGVICFGYDKNKRLHVLANKRGKGCEFNKGMWNIAGGFIDYGEDAKTCACREAYEETGVSINPNDVIFLDLNTDPVGARQTMTARFVYMFNAPIESIHTTNQYSEPDEVEEIKWIPCDSESDMIDIDNGRKWSRDQVKYIIKAKAFILKYNKWYNRVIRILFDH